MAGVAGVAGRLWDEGHNEIRDSLLSGYIRYRVVADNLHIRLIW